MPQPLTAVPLMSISAQPVRPPQQPAGQSSQLMRPGFGKHISSLFFTFSVLFYFT